jgi:hypothetical protein
MAYGVERTIFFLIPLTFVLSPAGQCHYVKEEHVIARRGSDEAIPPQNRDCFAPESRSQ